MKVFHLTLCLIGSVLITLQSYGYVSNPYERPATAKGYEETLTLIDASFSRHGDSELFLKEATLHYANGIDYVWPKHKAQIALTDNWILHLLGYVDPLLNRFGLTEVEDLFRAYQSLDYRRALRRGFGICSQNALGLASLLEDRYGIPSDIIGLSGHVVVETNVILLDPSVGLVLPYNLDMAEQLEAKHIISHTYREAFPEGESSRVWGFDGKLEKETSFADLGQYYDAAGNERSESVRGYRPKIYLLERASDWLRWLLPALLILLGLFGLLGQDKRCRR